MAIYRLFVYIRQSFILMAPSYKAIGDLNDLEISLCVQEPDSVD